MIEESDDILDNNNEENQETITKVTGMYKDWFLDYASYVILERAVPAIEDGFKPVQRRIMHSKPVQNTPRSPSSLPVFCLVFSQGAEVIHKGKEISSHIN